MSPAATLAADAVGAEVMPASHVADLQPPLLPATAAILTPLPVISALESAANAIHYFRATWARGSSDSGANGYGLFLDTGEPAGNLSGGFSGRGNPRDPDDYGPFALAAQAGLWRWLGRMKGS